MNKKIDIEKVLKSYSSERKLILIYEDLARRAHKKANRLSQEELDILAASIKSEKDLRQWEKFSQINHRIKSAMNILQGVKFEILLHSSNLRGYLFLCSAIENAMLIANGILRQIDDPRQRIKMSKKALFEGKEQPHFLRSYLDIDQDGYITVEVDDKYFNTNNTFTLWNLMENIKGELINAITRYVSWKAATLDYMRINRFNIKTYKDYIKQLDEEIFSPIINWDEASGFGGPPQGKDAERYREAFMKDYKKLEVEPSIYNNFIEDILG